MRLAQVRAQGSVDIAQDCQQWRRKAIWTCRWTCRTNVLHLAFASRQDLYTAVHLLCSAATQPIVAGPDPDKDDSERVSAKADPDLQRALGRPGPQGPALPEPLTTRQRAVVRALVDKHDSDIQAMVKDTKLNSALLSGHKLKRMVAAYHWHGADSSVQFQQPKKGLT